MKDIRQAQEYANYLSQTGWGVENLNGTFVYIKKIPVLGAVVKIQRPQNLSFELVNTIAKKYKAKRITIEPIDKYQVDSIKYHGYKQSNSPYLPTKTLVIDVTRKENTILQNFKNDARSAIKKAAHVEVVETENIIEFHSAWKKNTKSRLLLSSVNELEVLKQAFGKNCLILVTQDFSAAAIFLRADNTVYYWKAFTSPQGRKEFAQYKLVWEGILWAKKKKAKIFDFEGIYDERFPLKNWKGFSHFKKSFGGKEVEYPGAYIKTKYF